MKITKSVVRMFEDDQKEYGTETALFNILWQLAGDLLKDLGVTSIKTVLPKVKKLDKPKNPVGRPPKEKPFYHTYYAPFKGRQRAGHFEKKKWVWNKPTKYYYGKV